jgi:hypothetical protein
MAEFLPYSHRLIPPFAKCAKDPDFLLRVAKDVSVCGFLQGKPHEVHLSYEDRQEIRGMGHPETGGGFGTSLDDCSDWIDTCSKLFLFFPSLSPA